MQDVLARPRGFIVLDLILLALVLGGWWATGALAEVGLASLPVVAGAFGLMLLTALVMGLYRRNAVTEPRFPARCVVAVLACSGIVALVAGGFAQGAGAGAGSGGALVGPLIGAVTLCLLAMMGLRVALHRAVLARTSPRRILALLPEAGLRALPLQMPGAMVVPVPVRMDAQGGLTAEGRQAFLGALGQGEDCAEVIVSDGLLFDPDLALALAARQARGLRVCSLSRFMADEFGRLPHDDPETLRLIALRQRPRSAAALAPKRGMDVALSLCLLIMLAPVMAIAALLVKLEDGGPVLYRQVRVGLHQRTFTLLKFRSMRMDAEANGVARWADARDSRITRFGALMRLTRIDELPQLVNVLRGDMSLVGPRPERPEMIGNLRAHIPAYDLRHLVPPGLTGWAQINYPYGASVADAEQKTNYDLYYVANRSCIRDGLILLETIRVVLFAEGSR